MTEQQQPPTSKVFVAIESVMADIAKAGVGKKQTNTAQNFKYRGVDDVMDALSPLLAKHHLLILPSIIEHSLTERQTRNGASVLHALLKLTYEFICPIDGSIKVVGPIYGEAMDSGDKATNKAMSAAYKYVCIQSFCIPVTGDDPDASTHEIAGAPNESAHRPTAKGAPPDRARAMAAGPDTHPERSDRLASAVADSSASPAPVPGEKPDLLRPGGMFGYGKKFRDTPWDLMKGRDLEFFLNGDYTPEIVRHKIVAEMAWRDFELGQLDRVDEQLRKDRDVPLDDEIP
jgi:hypothetical protein